MGKEKIDWFFPPAGGGETQGFNVAAINIFQGSRIASLIRETIQNALDAMEESSKKRPVKVNLDLFEIEADEVPEIKKLSRYLEFARKTAISQTSKKDKSVKFYEEALALVNKSKVSFLAVHDFNTKGLRGSTIEIDGKSSPWLALVKGTGISFKDSEDALGAFGHGSKAPFAVSQLRTIFYLTKVPTDSRKYEWRFQGKSILQSMIEASGFKTQATGFYGITEECQPLINDQAPEWPIKQREGVGNSCGTSVFIPFPDLSTKLESSWLEVQAAVLASFYYAISAEKLEVSFGSEGINRDNLKERHEKLIHQLEKIDNRESREILDAMRPTNTIHDPTPGLSGTLTTDSFGEVDWYMQCDERVKRRRVAIARQNGMLITERAEGLTRFDDTRPFNLFLCVLGKEGNEILRRMENPQHNNFEIDRVQHGSERTEIKKRYEAFTREIRDLIGRFAGLDDNSEIFSDDLDELLGGFNKEVLNVDGNQLSTRTYVEERETRNTRQSNSLLTLESVGDEIDGVGPGQGKTIESGGKSSVELGDFPAKASAKSLVPVKDPRIVPLGSNKIKLFFTPTTKESFKLRVLVQGDYKSEILNFKPENSAALVDFIRYPKRQRMARQNVILTLRKEDLYLAYKILQEIDS
jgi:hypothetical protein